MDVQLPGIDGVEALRLLRGDPATSRCVSPRSRHSPMKDDRERLLAAGFDGYLVKPIDVLAFPSDIAALLDSEDGG